MDFTFSALLGLALLLLGLGSCSICLWRLLVAIRQATETLDSMGKTIAAVSVHLTDPALARRLTSTATLTNRNPDAQRFQGKARRNQEEIIRRTVEHAKRQAGMGPPEPKTKVSAPIHQVGDVKEWVGRLNENKE